MVAAIRGAGLPSALSGTAGTFVGNHLMYGVLHHLAAAGRRGTRAGFVHVPFIPAQVADRSAVAAVMEGVSLHPRPGGGPP